jgi:hypothetical protein
MKLSRQAISLLNELLTQYEDGLLNRGEVEERFAREAGKAIVDINMARIKKHGIEYCREHFFS